MKRTSNTPAKNKKLQGTTERRYELELKDIDVLDKENSDTADIKSGVVEGPTEEYQFTWRAAIIGSFLGCFVGKFIINFYCSCLYIYLDFNSYRADCYTVRLVPEFL